MAISQITSNSIATGAVSASDLADGSVTNAKIDTVAATKLTGTVPKAALPTGSILQVVNGQTSTAITGNSLSYTSIGLSVSITPISATSKLFIMVSFNTLVQVNPSYDETYAAFDIYNGSSSVAESGITNRWGNSSSAGRIQADMNMQAFIDASSTSVRTYTVRGKVQSSSDYYYIAMPDYVYASGAITINNTGNITIFEIAA